MKITKYAHACVRLDLDGRALVIDPGVWSEPSALIGVDAVLVTHEHGDHADVLRLAGLDVPVYAPVGAALTHVATTPVTTGQDFTAAGFTVRAVGGRHARVYGDEPACPNLGYVIDDRLYHPGDSLHLPGQAIETLLVPAHGSWLKTCEAIDFAKAVNPQRVHPIHEAQLNERGLGSVNAWFAQETGDRYQLLNPGESTTC